MHQGMNEFYFSAYEKTNNDGETYNMDAQVEEVQETPESIMIANEEFEIRQTRTQQIRKIFEKHNFPLITDTNEDLEAENFFRENILKIRENEDLMDDLREIL